MLSSLRIFLATLLSASLAAADCESPCLGQTCGAFNGFLICAELSQHHCNCGGCCIEEIASPPPPPHPPSYLAATVIGLRTNPAYLLVDMGATWAEG